MYKITYQTQLCTGFSALHKNRSAHRINTRSVISNERWHDAAVS
jgi:hypothetical protein